MGFAAETDNVNENAAAKLARKGADFIVANDVSPPAGAALGGVMGGDANTVTLLTRQGADPWPTLGKHEVATRLIARLADDLAALSDG